MSCPHSRVGGCGYFVRPVERGGKLEKSVTLFAVLSHHRCGRRKNMEKPIKTVEKQLTEAACCRTELPTYLSGRRKVINVQPRG